MDHDSSSTAYSMVPLTTAITAVGVVDGGTPPPPSSVEAAGGGVLIVICQADGCLADLNATTTMSMKYFRRHKVCVAHFKAPVVLVTGHRRRFCQRCSKFHELSRFDDSKRICRRGLAALRARYPY
uniref:SBP-type domain-containing protein n=1 Tax=Leersia perrieri TaxID=77586 RepID=A0A0D9XBL8_9ORYZ